mmetsp:Transcript_4818/g.7798  ORF Transcript_4818/g.7798 Transcript_4818/m.7798 type:complete len:96 (-) Transcript_4818:98-385(-)
MLTFLRSVVQLSLFSGLLLLCQFDEYIIDLLRVGAGICASPRCCWCWFRPEWDEDDDDDNNPEAEPRMKHPLVGIVVAAVAASGCLLQLHPQGGQ